MLLPVEPAWSEAVGGFAAVVSAAARGLPNASTLKAPAHCPPTRSRVRAIGALFAAGVFGLVAGAGGATLPLEPSSPSKAQQAQAAVDAAAWPTRPVVVETAGTASSAPSEQAPFDLPGETLYPADLATAQDPGPLDLTELASVKSIQAFVARPETAAAAKPTVRPPTAPRKAAHKGRAELRAGRDCPSAPGAERASRACRERELGF